MTKSAADLGKQISGGARSQHEKGTTIMTSAPIPLNGALPMWDTDAGQFIPTVPAETNGQHPADTTAKADHPVPRKHLAAVMAAAPGALIMNAIGFVNMLGALRSSSLGDGTGYAAWVLAGGLELGIVGFAVSAFVLGLRDRSSIAQQAFTVALSIVSAAIGYAHVAHTNDEVAVRVLVVSAPVLAAAAWHWTLIGVRSILLAEADIMRDAIAARQDHHRILELLDTASGLSKLVLRVRCVRAAYKSYKTQQAVSLRIMPERQEQVAETFVSGSSKASAILANVRPIDVPRATVSAGHVPSDTPRDVRPDVRPDVPQDVHPKMSAELVDIKRTSRPNTTSAPKAIERRTSPAKTSAPRTSAAMDKAERDAKIVAALDGGAQVKDVAVEFGMSTKQVSRIRDAAK